MKDYYSIGEVSKIKDITIKALGIIIKWEF